MTKGSGTPSRHKLFIFHTCAESSVASIAFGIGFPPLPWKCPECGQAVENYDSMSFDTNALDESQISGGNHD